MGQNPRKDASAVDGKDGRERNADDGECGKNGDGKSEEHVSDHDHEHDQRQRIGRTREMTRWHAVRGGDSAEVERSCLRASTRRNGSRVAALLDILRKLLETLDAPEDEAMFSCDQDGIRLRMFASFHEMN